MIRATDKVKRIDSKIVLPEHTKKELEELKRSIKENGVEIPIMVLESFDWLIVVDGWNRLQACRELGIDAPAIIISVNDTRALEIVLEENLSRRPMTQKQKKVIAYQLRNEMNLRDTQVAERLCISHVTVGKWLGPAKPASERKIEQNINSFFKKKCKTISKVIETIEKSIPFFCSMKENRLEEAIQGMRNLEEKGHALTDLLSEAIQKLNAPQQGLDGVNETRSLDDVEKSIAKLILGRLK